MLKFVCVVSLSQHSSRDMLCLCVLSRYVQCFVCVVPLSQHSRYVSSMFVCVACYLRTVVEIECLFVCLSVLSQPTSRELLYVKGLCVLFRYLSTVVENCCMLNVCVCCLVISAQ